MLRLKLRSMVTERKKYEATCKLGIKSKRKIAGWNEEYLLKILVLNAFALLFWSNHLLKQGYFNYFT